MILEGLGQPEEAGKLQPHNEMRFRGSRTRPAHREELYVPDEEDPEKPMLKKWQPRRKQPSGDPGVRRKRRGIGPMNWTTFAGGLVCFAVVAGMKALFVAPRPPTTRNRQGVIIVVIILSVQCPLLELVLSFVLH